jgi:hypothetical protein
MLKHGDRSALQRRHPEGAGGGVALIVPDVSDGVVIFRPQQGRGLVLVQLFDDADFMALEAREYCGGARIGHDSLRAELCLEHGQYSLSSIGGRNWYITVSILPSAECATSMPCHGSSLSLIRCSAYPKSCRSRRSVRRVACDYSRSKVSQRIPFGFSVIGRNRFDPIPSERGSCAFALVGAVILEFGTGRGNRTPTLLPELDFESSASTNSAIPAEGPQSASGGA